MTGSERTRKINKCLKCKWIYITFAVNEKLVDVYAERGECVLQLGQRYYFEVTLWPDWKSEMK